MYATSVSIVSPIFAVENLNVAPGTKELIGANDNSRSDFLQESKQMLG